MGREGGREGGREDEEEGGRCVCVHVAHPMIMEIHESEIPMFALGLQHTLS